MFDCPGAIALGRVFASIVIFACEINGVSHAVNRKNIMKTAQQLFDEHFTSNTMRTSRSAAYKRGALELWDRKIHGAVHEVPYKAGTAEFDAYFAGVDAAFNILELIKLENTV